LGTKAFKENTGTLLKLTQQWILCNYVITRTPFLVDFQTNLDIEKYIIPLVALVLQCGSTATPEIRHCNLMLYIPEPLSQNRGPPPKKPKTSDVPPWVLIVFLDI
jgi:hypothetical protein